MHEIEIEDWPALSKLCEHYAIGSWIFRGVANGDHPLLPAIGRPGARRSLHHNVELGYDKAQAEKLLRQFKLHARAHVSLAHDADDLEWLALGRHHGLPTPFLDWTTSLLVAAFFACQDGGVVGGVQRRAAIYATKCPNVVQEASQAFASTEPVAFYPPHVSPRIAAQSGLLTFHPTPDEPWQPEELVKLWISPGKAMYIKIVLARAGINEASMMPGLDGIAGYLGWLYKREFLEQVSQIVSKEYSVREKGFGPAGDKRIEVQLHSYANVSSEAGGATIHDSGQTSEQINGLLDQLFAKESGAPGSDERTQAAVSLGLIDGDAIRLSEHGTVLLPEPWQVVESRVDAVKAAIGNGVSLREAVAQVSRATTE